MKASAWVLVLLSLTYFLPLGASAQGPGPTNATPNDIHSEMVQRAWIVAGKVRTIEGLPIRGAAVTVIPVAAWDKRTLSTDEQGEFSTEYQLINGVGGGEFSVIVAVKKQGFETTHAYTNFGSSSRPRVIPLTLHDKKQEPDLLSPQDLVSSLAPALKQLGPEDGLAAQSEEDYTRGVAAFLEQHNADCAVPLLSKVAETNPSCIACRTMLGLAELGWNDWDGSDETLAQSANATLANQKMRRPEALVAYGTMLNWQHEPEKAEPFFEEALKLAPQNAPALQELGRTLLALQKFELANDVLRRALDAGAAPEARLLYAESWLYAGHTREASAEFSRYLAGRDVKRLPPQARLVRMRIYEQQQAEAMYANTKSSEGREIVDFLQHPPANLIQGLEPANDQEPLDSILGRVSDRTLEMFMDFPNTSSTERIYQEKLGRDGKVKNTLSQRFQYLCLSAREASGVIYTEYRTDLVGREASTEGLDQGFMLTEGFASAALIFHPAHRSESTFRYLGRQSFNGRETFVLAFAQIPGRARFVGDFQQNNKSVVTLWQGLAWIDTASYRVLRLHKELLAPVPQLRLGSEATDIEFNSVRFNNLKEPLWLPMAVTVTVNWNGKVLRNRHVYSHFKLFKVDASEKIGKPNGVARLRG